MFIEERNPITGELRWKVADEDYDLAQEIARSRFGDMLHDVERNHLYQSGLHSVIREMHKEGDSVHVVDIGTGTGLLSMMAVQAGADKVTAIEVFKPMADCAKKVFKDNGFENRIELITSRSTDLSLCSESEQANCIVAEVFDTELIGEGALRTFKNAHQTIAKAVCRTIPSSAKIWVVPVESSFLKRFHVLSSNSLRSPAVDCAGSAAVFDVQLSSIPESAIEMLCKPFVAFDFNFEDGSSLIFDESFIYDFTVESEKAVWLDAVLMWWDIDMDGSGKYLLSTAPKWWNPYAMWRDHWMQGVYYLSKSFPVKFGQNIRLRCSHDEVSLWFSVEFDNLSDNSRPYCTCGIHTTCSRNAIYRLNENNDDSELEAFLEKECSSKSVLVINAGSTIGVFAAKYAKSVEIFEYNNHFRSVLYKYADANELTNIRFLESESDISPEVDLILSEPYFFSSTLPWDNMRIWYISHELQKSMDGSRILPVLLYKFVVYAMPVHFDDLWKIVAPVGIIEGFDLSAFDKICLKARSATDYPIEAHSLWEYGCECSGLPVAVAEVTCHEGHLFCDTNLKTLTFRPRTANAIVFWGEWWFSKNYKRHGGPLENPLPGSRLKWTFGERQGVYFFPEERRIDTNCSSVKLEAKLNLSFESLSNDAEVFKFSFAFDR